MTTAIADVRLDDLRKYFLMSVKTDGHDFVTLVFQSHASQGDIARNKYVFLFECVVLEANWSSSIEVPAALSANVLRDPAGFDRFCVDFDSGRLVFRCADYAVAERDIRVSN